MRASKRKVDAFTIVEVLVVVAIVSLLIAISLPALQAAREAARRSSCSNNLKQIAIAASSYMDAFNCFPGSYGTCSALSRLLPYIEHGNVYNSINFESDGSIDNLTLEQVDIGVLLCPSDSVKIDLGMNNYGLNGGTGNLFNAPFSPLGDAKPVTNAQITDGTSSTALASEWLKSLPFDRRDGRRTVFQTASIVADANQFIVVCRDIDVSTARIGGSIKGYSWLSPNYGDTYYNHQQDINGHTCTNGSLTFSASWTVSSSHPGVVNTVFADSHVQAVRQTLSLAVWHALGTMNGGELIDHF